MEIRPKTQMPCLWVVPEPPSGDADSHDDADDHLGEENEEEDKKVEGTVTPRRKKTTIGRVGKHWKGSPWVCYLIVLFFFFKWRWQVKPEGFVNRAVPTHKGAGGEEEGPEDSEAQANTATRGVHAEHGQGGHHVEKQRGSTDWAQQKKKVLLRRAVLQPLLLYYTHTHTLCNSLIHTNKDSADVILRYLLPLCLLLGVKLALMVAFMENTNGFRVLS